MNNDKFVSYIVKYGRFFFLVEYIFSIFVVIGLCGRWLSLYFKTISNEKIYFNPLIILSFIMLIIVFPILISILANIVRNHHLEFISTIIFSLLILFVLFLRIMFISKFYVYYYDISLDVISETIACVAILLTVLGINFFRLFTLKIIDKK